MRRFTSALAPFLALAIHLPSAAAAQDATGGFLFAYLPHADSRDAFYEGYRAHLDWHRSRSDSLTWYGWDVLAGPRIGAFVDGVFGIPFAALDVRVDPAGDAADLQANVAPHGDAIARALVRERRDLSTAEPLGRTEPARLAQVVRYHVRPHQAAITEEALVALRERSPSASLLPYTVLETVVGAGTGVVLMVWRDRLGTFDEVGDDPVRAFRVIMAGLAGDDGATAVGLPEEVATEIWVYRPDLTYFGNGGGR